jgi:phage gp29-like protein
MAHKNNRRVSKSAKVKSPVHENAVVLLNKDLFTKFDLELRSPDKILQHEGFDYYDKMLDTDAHVYSIITTRKMGAGSFPYTLEPKNDSLEAAEQMIFIQFLLDEIPIENHFFDILDAIPKGFSIHEIVSRPTNKNDEFQNKIVIAKLVFHQQQHFIFKVKKKTGYELWFKLQSFSDEKKLPMEKFLHANFDSNSPYGKPLLEKLYWYYWFKKETGFKFWAIFLEKFGGPTAIMKYPSGDTSTALQTAANAALEDLQNSSGISIPDSFTLEFAKVSQGDISYQNMIDACNAEMSKAALGATQTVEEGRRGSYALSRTHTDVRAEYKINDVRILRKTIQPQIIDRFTRLNFANPLPPKIDFIIPKTVDSVNEKDPDHKGSIQDG